MEATVETHPNVALVKYWGKRDEALNLPSNGSISVTLAPLATITHLRFVPDGCSDEFMLDDRLVTEVEAHRLSCFVDLFRHRAGVAHAVRVRSHNNFPTAAGLASSASGYAALAMAAAEALGLRLSKQALSVLARQGSGSACRSLHGGFVEWQRGELPDGSDSCAIALAPASHWNLKIMVVVVDSRPKGMGSRTAMLHTMATSPFYSALPRQATLDLPQVREAIFSKDFAALASLAEAGCMAMFGAMLAARPSVRYWSPGTLAVLEEVEACRRDGLHCFYTMDAGPNVKVFCLGEDGVAVGERLRATDGTLQILEATVGGPARRCE